MILESAPVAISMKAMFKFARMASYEVGWQLDAMAT
jgi:hypothetical protein